MNECWTTPFIVSVDSIPFFAKNVVLFLAKRGKNKCEKAADLLYKSVPGLCLIISRAARYLPKPALNNIPSVCENNDLYD